MNPGLVSCYEAFDRLKANKAINENFKGIAQNKITNSIVSQEAGFGGGYLKNSRVQHQPLISMISLHVRDNENATMGKGAAIKREKDKAHKAKLELDSVKEKLEASLGRELQLYYSLKKVENEVILLKNELSKQNKISNNLI